MSSALICDASTPYYNDFITIQEALRCPVCEGQRIASSDAPFAVSVRKDICTYLQEGMNTDSVIARIEQDYGQGLRVDDGSVLLWPMIGVILLCLVAGGFVLRRALLSQTK